MLKLFSSKYMNDAENIDMKRSSVPRARGEGGARPFIALEEG